MDGIVIRKEGKAEIIFQPDGWAKCRLGSCLFLVRLSRHWPDVDTYFSIFCVEGEEEAFHLATDRYEGDAKLEKEIDRWNIRLNLYKEAE